MNSYPLKKYADYVSEKISTNHLNVSDYVTTDNILQNKQGITIASSLPAQTGKVTKYRSGDILLANIRPYLKKIWFSHKTGGCSADVLVFRAKININPNFLYYALFRDDFFNHVMNGAKGTKMPRGDKTQIMEFYIPEFDKNIQDNIAQTLSFLDKKIELNNRINAELEAIAKTLYDYWFVQFDFPDANGKPYKTSGGKMVYNSTLKREIPVEWSDMFIENCADLFRGVTYGKQDVAPPNKSGIGVLRATNITGNQLDRDELVYVDEDLVSEHQILKKFETLIVMSSGSTEHIGKNGIYYFDDKCAFGAFCSKLEIHKEYTFYLNTLLNTVWFKTYIKNQCLGTNINNLTNEHIKKCAIVKPDTLTLKSFDARTEPLYERIAVNYQENIQLKKLRDWLLPMLMNGQITVQG